MLVRSSRWWLALLYILATVLAQGLHDHGGGADAAEVRHEAGCDDSRPHLSGHWSPDLSHVQDHCLACQYRSQHQTPTTSPAPFHLDRASPARSSRPPPTRSGSLHRISCRAPPRV